jgi:hypothetical protein
MCYSALYCTKQFSLHSSTNVQLEALIMITALKTEDSCQQVNDRSVIWNDSHLFCDITRLRLVIRKERAH